MNSIAISTLTICGLEELSLHGGRGVTHVLSILDPDHPEPEAFEAYDRHHRTLLRFHDVIEPKPNHLLPERAHVQAILEFGQALAQSAQDGDRHLLIHCHAGISRSTAAMAALLSQIDPGREEDALFAQLVSIRPKAWPNSRMVGFADALLDRRGRMLAALGRLYRKQLVTYPHIREYMLENGRASEVAMADAA